MEEMNEKISIRNAELLKAVENYIALNFTDLENVICESRIVQETAPEYEECVYADKAVRKPLGARKARRQAAMVCANLAIPVTPLEKGKALERALEQMDESLSEMLIRLMKERDLKNSEVYKGALVSKAVFSNIMTKPDYRPQKTTLFALAVSLKLELEETRQLLERAGYALSHSFKLDVAMEYFIKNGNYNIFEINEVLLALDLPLLGERAA